MGKHRKPVDRRPDGATSTTTRLRVDPYIVALSAIAATASIVPVRGQGAVVFGWFANCAVGFLFFLYGARLSLAVALDGLRQWRLHTPVLASTFILFPALGLSARLLVPTVLSPQLYAGLLFLCCLPSTVQSSIAFTSIARGNVPAAICSASFSNVLGIATTRRFSGWSTAAQSYSWFIPPSAKVSYPEFGASSAPPTWHY